MDNKDKLRKLAGYSDSRSLLVAAMKELCPSRKSWFSFLVACVLSFLGSFFLTWFTHTQAKFTVIAELLNGTMLALFGVLFTVFTIFQALLNNDFLGLLLSEQPEKKRGETYLSDNYTYLEHLVVLYFIGVIINIGVLLITIILPENFLLFHNNSINGLIANLLIFIYLCTNVWIIFELRCVIFNISKLMRLYLMSNAKKALSEQEDNNTDANK